MMSKSKSGIKFFSQAITQYTGKSNIHTRSFEKYGFSPIRKRARDNYTLMLSVSSIQHERNHGHRRYTSSFGKNDNHVLEAGTKSNKYDTTEYRSKAATSLKASGQHSGQKHSLNSSVHYIIHRIPIGSINIDNLQKARAFISILSKWRTEQGAALAEALLERLFSEHITGGNPNAVVSTELYNVCIDAWSKSDAEGEETVKRVEIILRRMEQRFRDGYLSARPDRVTYNSVINVYSKSDEDSSEKIEAILEKMNNLADKAALERHHDRESHEFCKDDEFDDKIRPDTITYNSIMNYYASRFGQQSSAQRAEDLLLQISEMSRRNEKKIKMERLSFNIALKAWCNSGSGIHGAKRADAILEMMMKLYEKGHENVQPSVESFSTVINAYSKVSSEDVEDAVERVMQLLDIFERSQIHAAGGENSCYNAAANVIAKSGLEDAGDRIMDLINRMKNRATSPDIITFTSCIEGYARSMNPGSWNRGKEILLKIASDPQLKANSMALNVLLDSILKGSSKNRFEQADDLINLMEKIDGDSRPDSTSYKIVISALSRSSAKGVQQKAVGYLRRMLRSYRGGNLNAKPDSFVFNCCISLLARCNEEWADEAIHKTLISMEHQRNTGNKEVNPDTITYNLVIGKLAKANTKKNARKVMEILNRMEDTSQAGNKAAHPDIITYTSVLKSQEKIDPMRAAEVARSCLTRAMSSNLAFGIDRIGLRTLLMALSKSGSFEAAMTAFRAWQWLESNDKAFRRILDSELCNLVFMAFAKVGTKDSVNEAFSFLSDKIDRYDHERNSTILPTLIGFSVMLNMLSSDNRIEDALTLLEQMKGLSKKGMPGLTPDAKCYNLILTSLAKNHTVTCATQSLEILKLMKNDLGSMPITAFNAAINMCASTKGSSSDRRQALDVAFKIFQLARESQSYDAVTFELIMRACIKLTDDDNTRVALIKPVFRICAKNGLVGNAVMREINQLKDNILVDDELPEEWTRNTQD